MWRKSIADHVNVLWQKVYSRHIEPDRELLMSLPAGSLEIDCLTGLVTHDKVGALATRIGPHLASWFRSQRSENGIPDEFVISAVLRVQVRPDHPHPSDTLGFLDRWTPRCEIKTQDHVHVGEIEEYGLLRPSF
jgi:hypothetical protein